MLPVLPRLPDVKELIKGGLYYVLHAPRQSGKTTFLKFLTAKINSEGEMYAIHCSLPSLTDITDSTLGMTEVVSQLNESLSISEVDVLRQKADAYASLPAMKSPTRMVKRFLISLCEDLDKELVVFFDEADCLEEAPLIPFLYQIRDGYNFRDLKGSKFPKSLALVGMRDVRNYLPKVRSAEQSAGKGSPFNIKAEALTLPNFNEDEIRALYRQHTDATGQIFDESAVALAWHLSGGHPWLVNALANQVVVRELKNNCSAVITGEHIGKASQSLIVRNDTHFESLIKIILEPRVRRVLEAVVIGADGFPEGISDDDVSYTVDLGLIKVDPANSEIYFPANPIYQEVIVRVLSASIQRTMKIPESYLTRWVDGTVLDMSGLLEAFQIYWSENCEMYLTKNRSASLIRDSINSALEKRKLNNLPINNLPIDEELREIIINSLVNLVNEALVHLVLYAFLQRVLNGGADFIQREYALGGLRVDICVSYKSRRYPVEIKIQGNQSYNKSLEQLLAYMDKSRAEVGWLVLFDKDFGKDWKEKIYWETIEFEGKTVHLVGC
jgi:hypothetical protein